MTKSNVCSIYADLTKLLGDINQFLEEQVSGGYIKTENVNQALKLIKRSKRQIERIDAIAPQNDDYVIMHNNVSINEVDEKEEDDDHYALVAETNKKCDVADLPASEIAKASLIKSGPLTYHRKTDRWFFRREQYIKVFGAVYEDHLLIYKNDKSLRPLFYLNLLSYRANELTNSKKSGSFEVTNKIQTYNFIAQNEKDMEQWLYNINKFDCGQECLMEKPRLPLSKPKMHLQQRPIPEPPTDRRNSVSSADGNTYATPDEDTTGYYVINNEDDSRKDGVEETDGHYNTYSSVADDNETQDDDDDDEKIYTSVVPPPVPLPSSFIYRQTARH